MLERKGRIYMDLMDVSLPVGNKLVSKYVTKDEKVRSLFDYKEIERDETFSSRVADLNERSYPREDLSNYLLDFHCRYEVEHATINNIKRLSDPRSVVVIGGQQAGLLTGPLFTIHKLISIIKLAKEQQQRLNIPVIPVFWIAGEDHDFEEINHLFVKKNGQATKVKVGQRVYKKSPISALEIDKSLVGKWIEAIMKAFGETDRTTQLIQQLSADLEQSTTYVDFFIRLVYRLFPKDGLVVVDSGDEGFRRIGSAFMQSLILKNDELQKTVLSSQLTLKESGYGEPIEINEQNAHLFYINNGERQLLEKHNGQFQTKNNEHVFSEAELLEIASRTPYLLSNNVVTRPLMQEAMFPTLAFISGPGEIAYWATLKEAFHLFGFKMPLIIPRLMITIIDRPTNKYIEEHHLNLRDLLLSGCQMEKDRWLAERIPVDIERVTRQALEKTESAHGELRELAIEVDKGLAPLAEKNAEIIKSQILFLKQKMEKAVHEQHLVELRKFDHIDISLRPLNAPQERIWNIFYYINLYGYDFIDRLMELNFTWNNEHKVIFL